jgi:hypothetical protein
VGPGVAELLDEGDLLGVESRPASASTPPGSCSGKAVEGVGDDQLTLELGENGQHAEHGSPSMVVVSMPCSMT